MNNFGHNLGMARTSPQRDNFARDFSALTSNISELTLDSPILPFDIPLEAKSKPFFIRVRVPSEFNKGLIGTGGWHIREIQLSSKATIHVMKGSDIVWIFGDREEDIYRAKKMIHDYIFDQEVSVIKSIVIPIEFVPYFRPDCSGDLGGPGYLNTRKIKKEAGVEYILYNRNQSGEFPGQARFSIRGPPVNTDLAFAMVMDKIREIRAEMEQKNTQNRRGISGSGRDFSVLCSSKTPHFKIQAWVDRSYLRGLLEKDRYHMKQIERATGTRTWIDRYDDGGRLVPIVVHGRKDEDVYRAKKLIYKYISDQERSVHQTVVVPSALADHFRFKGCQINGRDIKKESGVEFIRWMGENHRARETMFDIRGPPENVEVAIAMVNDQVRVLLAQKKEKESSKKVEA